MLSDTLILVELKYCECCGGLWLRHKSSPEVYCAPCRPKLTGQPAAALPMVRRGRPRGASLPRATVVVRRCA